MQALCVCRCCVGQAAVLYPACCCRRCLLALMEFAERILFFCASFALPSRFRLRLSRSNLFSHHTLIALRKLSAIWTLFATYAVTTGRSS